MSALTRKALAHELDVSQALVTKHAKLGMPTHSVDAALAWRKANLRAHTMKGNRVLDVPAAPAVGGPEVAAVHRLWPVARAALDAGRFDIAEAEMRTALRMVPLKARGSVELDEVVFRRLVAHVYAAVITFNEPADGSPAPARVPLDAAEVEIMVPFWYSVAADEPIDWAAFK